MVTSETKTKKSTEEMSAEATAVIKELRDLLMSVTEWRDHVTEALKNAVENFNTMQQFMLDTNKKLEELHGRMEVLEKKASEPALPVIYTPSLSDPAFMTVREGIKTLHINVSLLHSYLMQRQTATMKALAMSHPADVYDGQLPCTYVPKMNDLPPGIT